MSGNHRKSDNRRCPLSNTVLHVVVADEFMADKSILVENSQKGMSLITYGNCILSPHFFRITTILASIYPDG